METQYLKMLRLFACDIVDIPLTQFIGFCFSLFVFSEFDKIRHLLYNETYKCFWL